MKGTWVVAATLCFCIGVTLFVNHLDNRLSASYGNLSADEHYADAEFRNAIIKITDEKGKQLYLTHAPVATHYTDNRSELTNPVILIEQKDGAPWRFASERATLMNSTKQAILQGAVYADREASETNEASHIKSRDVTVNYSTNYAHTDADTTIESGKQITTGTGMDIWFDKPTRIQLLSNVRSIFHQ